MLRFDDFPNRRCLIILVLTTNCKINPKQIDILSYLNFNLHQLEISKLPPTRKRIKSVNAALALKPAVLVNGLSIKCALPLATVLFVLFYSFLFFYIRTLFKTLLNYIHKYKNKYFFLLHKREKVMALNVKLL